MFLIPWSINSGKEKKKEEIDIDETIVSIK
jgi:hypothetical protein